MNILDQIVTELLEDRGVYFDAENVYNFAVLAYTHQTIKDLSPSTKSQLEFLLDEVKNNILVVYKNLIIRQIQKYIERNRTTQPITLDQESNETLETLLQKMKRTVRSDLKRPNERWEALLTAMITLEGSHATDAVIAAIDKIFNMVHNTKTNILGKFAGADELLKALDACAETPRVEAILPKVSHDVKEMFDAAGRNESAVTMVDDLLGEGAGMPWKQKQGMLYRGMKKIQWKLAKAGIESRYTQLRLHGAGFDIIYHTAQASSGDFAAWPVVTIDSGPQAGQYHNIYSVKSKGSLDDGLKAIMALHQLPTTEAPTAADFM